MNIQEQLDLLTKAINESTAALREILDAGSVPSNVTALPEALKPVTKEKAPPRRRTTPITETEDGEEPVVETPVPETPVTEETPETQAPAPADTDATIASIIETFKAKMTGTPDAERKGFLKTQLPMLRTKWGLGPDDKLAVLTPTPEKLVGLLADIEAL